MTNYDKYKEVLADIIIQNYKTDGESLWSKDNLILRDFEHIESISLDWLLLRWDEKIWWKPEILCKLVDTIALDSREDNDIALGLCSCDEINCNHCAFANMSDWGCSRSIRHWLEDESNEVIDNGTEVTRIF